MKVKICGLKRPEDIQYVNTYTPDFCGFIINFPKSHRSLSPDQVRELVKDLDRDRIKAVGVFVDQPVHQIAELLLDGTIDMAQLHGRETEEDIKELRTLLGESRREIIKAFQIREKADVLRALESSADYILLDQGKGSGETFDWSIVPEIARPYFLAGGIGPENLYEAASRLKPWAVDLSSSVETEKVKDPQKIKEVIACVRAMQEEKTDKSS